MVRQTDVYELIDLFPTFFIILSKTFWTPALEELMISSGLSVVLDKRAGPPTRTTASALSFRGEIQAIGGSSECIVLADRNGHHVRLSTPIV